jgi:hypothetical protein
MKSEKVSQFVIKLIKLTTSDEVKWTSYSTINNELLNGEVILDKTYLTSLNGRKFQLYKYKYKVYRDEYDYEWSQKIRLGLVDINGKSDYEFEYDNSMNDLYDIVRERTSNIMDIVDDILGLTLEIIEARYFTSNHSKDITEKVKNLVKNNSLVLKATNEIDGDPEPRIVKQLKIIYKYAGETKEKEVQEGQIISLP